MRKPLLEAMGKPLEGTLEYSDMILTLLRRNAVQVYPRVTAAPVLLQVEARGPLGRVEMCNDRYEHRVQAKRPILRVDSC